MIPNQQALTIVEGLLPDGPDSLEAPMQAEVRLREPAVLRVHSHPLTDAKPGCVRAWSGSRSPGGQNYPPAHLGDITAWPRRQTIL